MKNKGRQIYTIADTHFGHKNMTEWALRPENFNEKLWKGFDNISDNDILIHCGDLTMCADKVVSDRLRAYKFKKWLIRGNHDKHSISWYLDNGWDFVADELVVDMFGHKILFTHIPQPKREGITKNIHGHLHGGKSRGRPEFYDETYHQEVTPEVIGYAPARLGRCVG